MFLQQLALLDGFEIARLDPVGPDFVHLVTECAKLAFADREAFYGDPGFVEVPLSTLLSPAYNAERRRLVTEQASHEQRPGTVPGHGGSVARGARPAALGQRARRARRRRSDLGRDAARRSVPRTRSGDTCHLDIVDRWGNMVSATPSGGWLHSSPIIPELGFCLGTRAQMFWLEEGLPASLAPGKRPRSTLTPSLALPRRASRRSPSARRAATIRTNGASPSSCGMSITA